MAVIAAPVTTSRDLAASSGAARPRLLYAEDEEPVVRMARRRLAAHDIDLVWAGNGEEALRLATREQFDVIALDYRMPGFDGLEVLRALREAGHTEPVVMISGMGNLEVAVEAVRLGASDYLIKDPSGAYLDLLPTTVLRLLEQQRLKLERERANAARARLMAALAHDLHQPLVALRLQLEDLGTQLESQPLAERVQRMMRFVRVGETMLEQITEQSALESGRIVPTPRPVDLATLVEELAAELRPLAADKGIRLRGHGGPGPLTVSTDPALFRRLLGNLVSNALRYTDRGGVLVALRRRPLFWRVDVWDTGTGIAPADMPNIFEDFYRGAGQRGGGGVGLGLATVRQIAEMLGLSISVQSRQGRGSCFSVGGPMGGESL